MRLPIWAGVFGHDRDLRTRSGVASSSSTCSAAVPALVAALRDNRVTLLLDNCEPVIDAAAGLAAAVLGETPRVKILASSRD
jgi:predicted ATPase